MRNPQGYLTITDPDVGCLIEYDTFTCKHCNTVVPVPPPPKNMPGGMCLKCSGPICDKCVYMGECIPFERAVDLLEKAVERTRDRDRFFRSVGL